MRRGPLLILLALAVVGFLAWMLMEPAVPPPAPPASTGPSATADAGSDADATSGGPEKRLVNAWKLRGYGSVVGVLKEFGTDRALGDVSVHLQSGVPGPGEELKAITAADGSFSFEKAPNFDNWTLRALPPSPLGELEMAGVEVTEFRATDLGTLYATPGFRVPGMVVDEKGDPVPGARVRALRARAPSSRMDFLKVIREIERPPPAVDSALTGEDGRFTLTRVPPGTYDFEVSRTGFAQALEQGLVINPDAETNPLRLVLVRGFTLRGRVVRKGGGSVEGLPVVSFEQPENDSAVFDLNKRITATDDAGEFTLEGLAAGTTSVVVKPPGEPFALQLDIEIPAQDWIEIVIEGDAWLEGRIVNPENRPVEGAQVYVLNFRKDPPMVGVAVTDPEGRYRIAGLKSGPIELFMVQAEGFGTYPADFMSLLMGRGSGLVLQKGANEKNVTLDLGGVVRGTVLEEGTDAPIEGVRVSLVAPASLFGGARTATTDSSGAFEIRSVPEGSALLVASKDGWLQPGVSPSSMMGMAMQMMGGPKPDSGEGAVISIEKPGAEVERTLHLQRGTTLRGTVLNPAGEPVRGARVASELASRRGGMMAELNAFFPMGEPRLTADDGSFTLPGPAPGQSVVVKASAQGYLATTSVAIEGGESDPAPVTITMRTGAVLTGRVLSSDGRPLENALVRYTAEAEDDEWTRGWRLSNARPSHTDAEGRYRIVNVETGNLTVQVQHARFLSASKSGVTAAEGAEADLDWKLEKGLLLRGVVLGADGKPVANARVNVDYEGPLPEGGDPFWSIRNDLTTDAAGAFSLDGVYPGTYDLRAEATGAAPSDNVKAAAGGEPVTLRLATAHSISGTVRTVSGKAMSNVRVRAYLVNGEEKDHKGATNTSAEGRFELPELPAGIYELSVEGGWGLGSSRPNLKAKTVSGITAGTKDLIIEVEEGLRIAGIVKEADGTPLAEGWLYASPDPQDERPQAGSPVLEGRFDIPGLGEGKYTLHVNRSGKAARQFKVTAGQTDLVIELSAGGTVRGRVTSAAGAMVSARWVMAQGESGGGGAQSGDDGSFEIEGLAPGTYRIVCGWQDDDGNHGGQSEEFEVRDGGTVNGVEVEVKVP